MTQDQPFNPLDKFHLGESVADAMLERPICTMPLAEEFAGAGIYAVYYSGDFPLYARITQRNRDQQFGWPIYVGKAIPAGGRRGKLTLSTDPGKFYIVDFKSMLRALSRQKISASRISRADS